MKARPITTTASGEFRIVRAYQARPGTLYSGPAIGWVYEPTEIDGQYHYSQIYNTEGEALVHAEIFESVLSGKRLTAPAYFGEGEEVRS